MADEGEEGEAKAAEEKAAADKAAAEKIAADELAAKEAAAVKAAEATEAAEGKSAIEVAKEMAERLEAANKVMETNIKKAEKVFAEQMLGGKSFAGQPAMTEEQKEIAQAKELIAGTGFEKMLFPEVKDAAGKT